MSKKIEKMYTLEERTLNLSVAVRKFVLQLPKTLPNAEDIKQLVRSSGSVGANYIEANEALSKKDFVMRIRISRKEAKESVYWLNIIMQANHLDLSQKSSCEALIKETNEIRNILSSILNKTL